MKFSVYIFVLSACLLPVFFNSCHSVFSNESNGVVSEIRLSEKDIRFSSDADSVVILISGESWDIADIVENGSRVYQRIEGNVDSSDCFSTYVNRGWFNLRKEENDRLVICVDRNVKKMGRSLNITLESGNFFDRIGVYQEGE